MARRKDRKKTIVAFAVLGLGLAVAVPRLVSFGGDPVVIEDGVLFPEDDEPALTDGRAAPVRDGGPQADLLAAFGSWPVDAGVRRAFGEPDEVPVARTEAVAPEPDAPVTPPPRHLVSMVLLARPMSRAVVDTTIVCVGDEIAAGTVTEIHAGGIVVTGPRGRLDYDLGMVGARGFEGVPDAATAAGDAWTDDAFATAGEDTLGEVDAALLQALEVGILGGEDGGDPPRGDG